MRGGKVKNEHREGAKETERGVERERVGGMERGVERERARDSGRDGEGDSIS